MLTNDVLIDGFERVKQSVHIAVKGLTAEQLATMPEIKTSKANSIAWLVWHIARVQDDHVAGLAGGTQIWTSQDWHTRFGLPFAPDATGYGQSLDEVAQVRVAPDLLTDYYDAVHTMTISYIADLSADSYAEIVDENWNPPVTRAVRLMSILNDGTQHVGQVGYVRGLIE
jgi:uncharacterized damage-inducible protein DinB